MSKNSVTHEEFIATIKNQTQNLEALLYKIMDAAPKPNHQVIYELKKCLESVQTACNAIQDYQIYREGLKSLIFAVDRLRRGTRKYGKQTVTDEVGHIQESTKEWMEKVFSSEVVERYFQVAEIEDHAYVFLDIVSSVADEEIPIPGKLVREGGKTFPATGRELVDRCECLKSIILPTMPAIAPELQRSYDFNLKRLHVYVLLLHKSYKVSLSISPFLPTEAISTLNTIYGLVNRLVKTKSEEKTEIDRLERKPRPFSHEEFARKMIFDDIFSNRIEIELPTETSPEIVKTYEKLTKEYKDDRIQIYQRPKKYEEEEE